MIAAPARIQDGNVEGLVAEMISEATRTSGHLSFDMTGVESISRSAGAVLCSALLTHLAAVELDVLPPKRRPIEKLLSSTLGFAFAHRTGLVHVRDVDEQALALDRWRLPYTPARRSLPFDEYDLPEEPSFARRFQAAFVNPHETARRNQRNDVPYRIQGWLHAVLPPRALVLPFVEDLHALVYELVDNVAEHAEVEGVGTKSIVVVSVARGKSPEIRDRIWVLVMDTGPGIIATVAPKLTPIERLDLEHASGREKALAGLFTGDYLHHGRARGLGLPRVNSICRRWSGTKLEASTDHLRLAIEGDSTTVTPSALRLRGTLILARFTTPPTPAEA